MSDEDIEEILHTLGLDDESDLAASPTERLERRLASAVVEARREGMDYWRLFEVLERYQRAAVRAAFRDGEFGAEYVGDVGHDTVQYSQVVHATAQAIGDGAEKRDVLVNLASAYRLFEHEWSANDEWSPGDSDPADRETDGAPGREENDAQRRGGEGTPGQNETGGHPADYATAPGKNARNARNDADAAATAERASEDDDSSGDDTVNWEEAGEWGGSGI